MTTVSPIFIPLVSINHRSMRTARERLRKEAMMLLNVLWPKTLVIRWTNRVEEANNVDDPGPYSWLRGATPASVARFVRNLRPSRDPAAEKLRKKWYTARTRMVVIYPEPDDGGYWMAIPAKGAPSDGSGNHIGMFAMQGSVVPSVFERSNLSPDHRRFYPPLWGTFIEDLPQFNECVSALRTRYLSILRANPSDPRL